MPSERTIVSVTSYPPRLKAAATSIRTLIPQAKDADAEVHLWLAIDDFEDASEEELSETLAGIEDAGAVVCWCDETLGPHDKYYWEMQENPHTTIITFDDDLLYPSDVIGNLLSAHKRHPHCVIATRTHLIKVDDAQSDSPKLARYTDWMLEQAVHVGEPRYDLLATGVGGILYPPCAFDDALFDEDAIRETTLMTDDLWLYANELLCDIPVVSVSNFSLDDKYITGTQEGGLAQLNRYSGGNDAALARIFEKLPQVRDRMIAEAKGNEASMGIYAR